MTEVAFGEDSAYRPVNRSRIARVITLLVAAFVALNLVAAIVTAMFPDRIDGPAGSSFVTTERGLGAFREVLIELDRPVSRLRQSLAETSIDDESVLVVYGSLVDADHQRAIQTFVERGGSLITTAENATAFIGPVRLSEPEEQLTYLPVGYVATSDIASAVGPGTTVFADAGAATPIMSAGHRSHLVVVAERGNGTVYVISDADILSNRWIAEAHNAALGVGLTRGRPVVFDEFIHGYTITDRLAAFRSDFTWLVALAVAAAVVWVWASSRRIGPPEQPDRLLPPRRAEFLDGLAASLVRANVTEGGYGDLRRYGQRLLAEAADRRGSGDRAMELAAAAAGLTKGERTALATPVGTDADALHIASAVAKLRQSHQRKDTG